MGQHHGFARRVGRLHHPPGRVVVDARRLHPALIGDVGDVVIAVVPVDGRCARALGHLHQVGGGVVQIGQGRAVRIRDLGDPILGIAHEGQARTARVGDAIRGDRHRVAHAIGHAREALILDDVEHGTVFGGQVEDVGVPGISACGLEHRRPRGGPERDEAGGAFGGERDGGVSRVGVTYPADLRRRHGIVLLALRLRVKAVLPPARQGHRHARGALRSQAIDRRKARGVDGVQPRRAGLSGLLDAHAAGRELAVGAEVARSAVPPVVVRPHDLKRHSPELHLEVDVREREETDLHVAVDGHRQIDFPLSCGCVRYEAYGVDAVFEHRRIEGAEGAALGAGASRHVGPRGVDVVAATEAVLKRPGAFAHRAAHGHGFGHERVVREPAERDHRRAARRRSQDHMRVGKRRQLAIECRQPERVRARLRERHRRLQRRRSRDLCRPGACDLRPARRQRGRLRIPVVGRAPCQRCARARHRLIGADRDRRSVVVQDDVHGPCGRAGHRARSRGELEAVGVRRRKRDRARHARGSVRRGRPARLRPREGRGGHGVPGRVGGNSGEDDASLEIGHGGPHDADAEAIARRVGARRPAARGRHRHMHLRGRGVFAVVRAELEQVLADIEEVDDRLRVRGSVNRLRRLLGRERRRAAGRMIRVEHDLPRNDQRGDCAVVGDGRIQGHAGRRRDEGLHARDDDGRRDVGQRWPAREIDRYPRRRERQLVVAAIVDWKLRQERIESTRGRLDDAIVNSAALHTARAIGRAEAVETLGGHTACAPLARVDELPVAAAEARRTGLVDRIALGHLIERPMRRGTECVGLEESAALGIVRTTAKEDEAGVGIGEAATDSERCRRTARLGEHTPPRVTLDGVHDGPCVGVGDEARRAHVVGRDQQCLSAADHVRRGEVSACGNTLGDEAHARTHGVLKRRRRRVPVGVHVPHDDGAARVELGGDTVRVAVEPPGDEGAVDLLCDAAPERIEDVVDPVPRREVDSNQATKDVVGVLRQSRRRRLRRHVATGVVAVGGSSLARKTTGAIVGCDDVPAGRSDQRAVARGVVAVRGHAAVAREPVEASAEVIVVTQ